MSAAEGWKAPWAPTTCTREEAESPKCQQFRDLVARWSGPSVKQHGATRNAGGAFVVCQITNYNPLFLRDMGSIEFFRRIQHALGKIARCLADFGGLPTAVCEARLVFYFGDGTDAEMLDSAYLVRALQAAHYAQTQVWDDIEPALRLSFGLDAGRAVFLHAPSNRTFLMGSPAEALQTLRSESDTDVQIFCTDRFWHHVSLNAYGRMLKSGNYAVFDVHSPIEPKPEFSDANPLASTPAPIRVGSGRDSGNLWNGPGTSVQIHVHGLHLSDLSNLGTVRRVLDAIENFVAPNNGYWAQCLTCVMETRFVLYFMDTAHATRALRATLGIVQAIAKLGQRVRVAVATDTTLIASPWRGFEDFNTARGLRAGPLEPFAQTPSHAKISAMLSSTGLGILCCDETVRHAIHPERHISFPVPPIVVPGLASARMEASAVFARNPEPVGGSSSGLTVGRDRHLYGREAQRSKILRSLTTFLNDGESQAITLQGSSGMGKSSLVLETIRIGRQVGCTVLAAVGEPMESKSPFFPFVALLSDLLRLEPGTDQAALSAAVTRVLGVEHSSAAVLLKDLLLGDTVQSLDLGRAAKQGTKTFEAMQGQHMATQESVEGLRCARMQLILELFRAESERRPLVIAFDELQYFDTLSLEMIAKIAESVDRVLMIFALPPVVVSSRLGGQIKQLFEQIHGCMDVHQVELTHLTRQECRELAASVIGARPVHELVTLLLSRSQGHPLHLEQLVTALVSGNAITTIDGKARLTNVAGALVKVLEDQPAERPSSSLPDQLHSGSVSGCVLARMRDMSREQIAFLQTASCFGTTFSVSAVAVVGKLPSSAPDAQACIKWLARDVEFMVQQRQRSVFKFAHPSIHGAIYMTIDDKEKRDTHSKIAELLIQSGGESRLYHTIIYHLGKVVDSLVDTNFDVSPEYIYRMAKYLERAGDLCRDQGAYKESITLLESALRVLDLSAQHQKMDDEANAHHLALLVTTLSKLWTVVLFVKGESSEESETVLKRTQRLLSTDNARELVPVLVGTGFSLTFRNAAKAVELLEWLVEWCTQHHQQQLLWVVRHFCRLPHLLCTGRLGRALELCNDSEATLATDCEVEVSPNVNSPLVKLVLGRNPKLSVMLTSGLTRSFMGQLTEARERFRQCDEALLQNPDRKTARSKIRTMIMFHHWMHPGLGDPVSVANDALQCANKAAEWRPLASFFVGWALSCKPGFEAVGIPKMESSMTGILMNHGPGFQVAAGALLADRFIKAGLLDRADQTISRFRQVARDTKNDFFGVEILRLEAVLSLAIMADSAASQGLAAPLDAESCARRFIKVFTYYQKCQCPPLQLRAAMSLAGIKVTYGLDLEDPAGAVEMLKDAIDRMADCKEGELYQDACVTLGELQLGSGRRSM